MNFRSATLFDYVEVFDAIPVPATLIDAQGNVVDINQAFLEYARRLGRPISKEDRIGRPIATFARSEEDRVRFEAFIRDLLHQGSSRHLRWKAVGLFGTAFYLDIHAQVLKDAAGQVTGAVILREDITEQVRQEQRKQIIARARDAIWQMHRSADMEQVLSAVRECLQDLGIPFTDCGVNLVDASVDPPAVQIHSLTQAGTWIRVEKEQSVRLILQFWRDQKVAYRQDLRSEDPYGEGDYADIYEHSLRSIVDAPFSHGTLAVNSTEPGAFSPQDIGVLQEVAQVLSEGFSRMEDFRTLEQRNQELESEILERRQTEKALQDSEARYRNLLYRLPIGIVVSTLNEISFYNPRALEMLGLEAEDIAKIKPVDIYVDPQDREELLAHLHRDGRHEYEYWLRRKDGEKILVRGRSVAIRDPHDKTIRYEGYMEDITERRRQEDQRQARHRVREEVWKMQSAEDIWKVLEAVGQSLETVGISFQDWGINVVDTSTDPPTVRFHNMTRGGEGRIGEIEHRGKDQIMKIWQTGRPLYRQDLETEDIYQEREYIGAGFSHSVRSVIDIPFTHGTFAVNSAQPDAFSEPDIASLQEMAEVLSEGFQRMEDLQQLAAERERLLVTLRSIGDGVIATDADGITVLINQVAEQLTGWTQEEAEGRSLAEVFHIVNEHTRQPCEDPVSKVMQSGLVVGLANHTVLIARDGTERSIADSGAPIRDREGGIIGVALVFRDVTAQRKMEAELLKSEKLESLGVLAGGIAHDFNNILMTITGTLSLAKMDVDPADALFGTLTQLEEAAQRAAQLTQQLLTFSKGGAPLKKAASIAEIIEDSATFALRGSNVRCEYAMSGDLWPVEVDAGQISQVIQNLVINADQAMPGGGILRIGAKNVTPDPGHGLPLKEGNYIEVSVADQGVGIPQAHLQRIFEPYFTTKQKGSGLGLATAYSIVNNHDGHIAVKSEMGVSTTFRIFLPALSAEVRPEKKAETALPVGQGRVLVMDDDENVRELAGRMLERLGYEAAFASEGAEALALYQKERETGRPFVAVILDLTIPGGMGGKETIRKLLEMDVDAQAIVSSGYSNDPIMAEFGSYGFKGVVAKPYDLSELGQVLRRVLTGEDQ